MLIFINYEITMCAMKYSVLIIIFCLFNSILPAQSKLVLTPEKMYEITSANGARISPNGEKLLFTLTSFHPDKNKYVTQLWIKDLYKTKLPYKIAPKDSSCSSPSWTPDGTRIAFLKNGGGSLTQLFIIDLKNGSSIQVTNHNSSLKSYSWISKEKIIFTAEPAATQQETDLLANQGGAFFFDEDKKNTVLWEYDLTTKQEKALTGSDISIRAYKLSPDGKQMALIAAPSANPADENKSEIYLLDLVTAKLKRLTNNSIMEKQLGWSSDGSFITFISDASKYLEPYYQDSIFKLDIKTGAVTDLLADFGYQALDHQHDWKRDLIYFIANKGVTQQLFSYNFRTTRIKQHSNVKGVIKSFVLYAPKNKIIYLYTDPEIPNDFYLTFPGKWNVKRLTYLNPQLKNYDLGIYKTAVWKSYDKKEVEGVLIYPPGFNKYKKYPLLVQLHGGPNASYQLSFGFSWVTYPNYLASKGYIILQPNYRGSTGYGDDFMRGIIKDLFTKGFEDIMSGVDHLISSGIADEKKLGIMGFSAGGHFTNWIITHTNRFKAASSGAGASNLLSFYAQNEVPYLREIWMNNVPYENVDTWTKQSPVTYVKNVKTPTFIYCGDKDTRVPMPQSVEMYRGLKRYKVPAKLLVLPGATHDISDMKHQLTKMKYEFEWIETWMNRGFN